MRDIEAKAGYPDDDDLAQAVILAAACHGAEALDADDLAQRFWVWGEENGLGMGRATLARYGGSPPKRYESRSLPQTEAARFGEAMRLVASETADANEGKQAFREKRSPVWQGK